MIHLLLLLLIMICLLFILHRLFQRSLKRTIYSYTNIGYVTLMIGVIFFTIVQISYIIIYGLPAENDVRSHVYRSILTFPKVFAMYTIPILTIIFLFCIVSNVSLVRHEGMHIKNALGLYIGVAYIGATVVMSILSEHSNAHNLLTTDDYLSAGDLAWCFAVIFALNAICYLECFLFAFLIMSYIAEKHVPTYDKDCIIILGCSIAKSGALLPLLKGRVNKAIRFAWDQEIATGKPVKYVPSGGQGANEIMAEGSAMEFYLLTHGAEDYEIMPEKKSLNTYENFLYSKKIIDEKMPDAKVAFSTTNYHVLRSGILARDAGIPAEGIASSTKWYFWPNGLLREFVGLFLHNKKPHLVFLGLDLLVCIILGSIWYILP